MKKKSITGLLLSAPSMLLIIAIMVIPLFYTVYCSLFNLDYLQFGGFVGLKNYQKILKHCCVEVIVNHDDDYDTFDDSFLVAGTLLALWADRQTGFRIPDSIGRAYSVGYIDGSSCTPVEMDI